jgi:hypothetical protein
MTTREIAKRLSAVELEVAQLKANGLLSSAQHPVHALEKIHGTFENDDAFKEAMRLGRKWRNSGAKSKVKRK